MNIDDMQAGPEMDALIATEVMGWTFERHNEMKYTLTEWWKRNDGKRYISRKVWRPTSNIAHAMETLDHWATAGDDRDWITGRASVYFRPLSGGQGGYWCELDDEGVRGAAVYAMTLPLAICRAALKAVRG